MSGTEKCYIVRLDLRERRTVMMRHLLLVTATIGMLFSPIVAHAAGVANVGAGQRGAGPAIKMAMGPVSAPHLPSGTVQPEGSTSGCPQGSCSAPAKKAKHRHKSSSQH
jgi:hypothetical protein